MSDVNSEVGCVCVWGCRARCYYRIGEFIEMVLTSVNMCVQLMIDHHSARPTPGGPCAHHPHPHISNLLLVAAKDVRVFDGAISAT